MAAPPGAPPPKLRILCLHGYRQNATAFRRRIGHLSKGLRATCELEFVDAPHAAPSAAAPDGGGGGGDADGDAAVGADPADPRSWWRWEGDPAARPSLTTAAITGWHDASRPLLEARLAGGHYDGVLGFSQGAAAAALLLAGLPADRRPRFAILAGGFAVRDAGAAAALAAAPVAVPTLMVAGDGDALVPVARTEELARIAFAPGAVTWLRHPGGHCVPTCSGGVRESFRAFVERFRRV